MTDPANTPTPLRTDPGAVTRLTVNIGPRTAGALNDVVAARGVTLTEALRLLVADGYAVARTPTSPDPAAESAAEQLITDAAYVVHAAAAKELGLGGDHLTDPPAAPDYAAVRALARRRMLAPVELFHDVERDHADMIRYRRALREIVRQHVPDESGDPRMCMRCHDCAGEPIEHPCPTARDAAAALAPSKPPVPLDRGPHAPTEVEGAPHA